MRGLVLRYLYAIALGGLAALPGLGAETADRPFDELLAFVPRGANTLVLLNVEKVLSSPTAVIEDTKKRMAFRFAEGAIALPSDALRVVMAAQMDFRRMQPVWEVLVMDVDELCVVENMARAARGYVDPLGDVETVWSPYDQYMVKLDSFRVGAMGPANRQAVSRWVHAERNMALSPYLQRAARYANEGGTEIIIALDLHYVLDPDRVWMRLPRLKSLQGRDYSREHLHKLLLSVRGAMIGVTFRDLPYGSLKIDFGQDAYPMENFAKPLLLELLDEVGAGVDTTDDWQARVDGKTVTLSGFLSDSARRRLASIIQLRPPSQSPLEEPGSAAGLSKGEATRQQYNFVGVLLRDLKVRAREPDGFDGLEAWLDRYAKRIEELPTQNIDSQFLQYRRDVAGRLRRMIDDLRYGDIPGYSRRVYRAEYDSFGSATEELMEDGESPLLAEARAINGSTLRIAKALSDRYKMEF